MAQDYKHRVGKKQAYNASRRRPQKSSSSGFWRLLLVAILIVAFVLGLNTISKIVPELMSSKTAVVASVPVVEDKLKQEVAIKPQIQNQVAVNTQNSEPKAEPVPAEPEEPRYDFYTILPQAEVVVPDYEIKTRVREELVGKAKTTTTAKYMMQAGSFREAAEAENHKAKLAKLGIEARVEPAKVGNVMWHRVKIGPYDNPSSVSTIKELLAKNGIGVIVTEAGGQ